MVRKSKEKKMRKLMMILSSTILLSACGTTQGINPSELTAPIKKNQARVTVTRDTSMLYLAAPVTVKSNGQQIASLGRGGSVVHNIQSGQNVLSVSTPSAFGQFVVRFNAKAQETYNFKVSPKGDALFLGSAFGMAGDAINAKISDTSGYFELELKP